MEATPNGIIMILHEGFTKIDPQKCIDAMPETWQRLHKETITVSYSEKIVLGDSQDLDFSQYALEHKRIYSEKILSVVEANKNFQIVYFGLVPIPLGIDFGHLFYNYDKIEIYQFHNQKKEWYQTLTDQDIAKENQLVDPILPSIDQKGITNALVRLSISHKVNPEETTEVIPNAAEIDFGFLSPKEAIINSKEQLVEIGEGVKTILDELSNNRSGLEVIHLFASIPCGVAFLIGTKISPNIHPYIQTYQYKNTETPKYSKAILVKKKIETSRKITGEDRKKANNLREKASKELRADIADFCERNKAFVSGRTWSWPLDLISIDEGIMNEPFWSELPAISKTGIEKDQCSQTPDVVENGFIRKGNRWHIDDYFFVALSQNEKISIDDNVRKAFRLFFFHEILHVKIHEMGNGKNENIGSFPKVLETADYQADVYAILNEYGLQHQRDSTDNESKDFFRETIEIAIETMWCFDDQGYELTQIQIRRLNRYLIWYWQLIRIEKSNGNLNEIVKILEEKPIIELSGLKIKVDNNNRSYFNLEQRQGKYLEIAVFVNNKVIRNGSASNFQIENLIEGVKKMDGNRILEELSRFYPSN